MNTSGFRDGNVPPGGIRPPVPQEQLPVQPGSEVQEQVPVAPAEVRPTPAVQPTPQAEVAAPAPQVNTPGPAVAPLEQAAAAPRVLPKVDETLVTEGEMNGGVGGMADTVDALIQATQEEGQA